MNYELAKELKDVGFSQDGNGIQSWYDWNQKEIDRNYDFLSEDNESGEYIYLPTLSELIEACGYKLRAIQREDYEDEIYDLETPNEKKWCAVREWYQYYPPAVESGEYGSTPEEAVARLWLTLNKKD